MSCASKTHGAASFHKPIIGPSAYQLANIQLLRFKKVSVLTANNNDVCYGRCTLRELYEAIMTMFPYYRRPETRRSWQNSVRHSLSFNDCFVKLPPRRSDSSASRRTSGGGTKGGCWTLHPEARRMFDHGCFLRRTHRFRCRKYNESGTATEQPHDGQEPTVIEPNEKSLPSSAVTSDGGDEPTISVSGSTNRSSPTVSSSTDNGHFNHPFSISTLMRNVRH